MFTVVTVSHWIRCDAVNLFCNFVDISLMSFDRVIRGALFFRVLKPARHLVGSDPAAVYMDVATASHASQPEVSRWKVPSRSEEQAVMKKAFRNHGLHAIASRHGSQARRFLQTWLVKRLPGASYLYRC